MRGTRLTARDVALALTLFVVYVAILVKTAHVQGYARDEGFYFSAAEAYGAWIEKLVHAPASALTKAAVDGAFGVNHEHPALCKMLFALSWTYLYKRHHLFAEEGTSFRFPGMCFAGLTLAILYLWGTEARSRRTGFAAALLFALVPTTFYHAHLDCFDVPIAAMWLLVAWAYWRSIARESTAWAIATGVLFGLALDTKHNSWFLPPALVLHTLLFRARHLVREIVVGNLRIPLALPAMAILGPIVFVASWPWIWFDTASRIAGYVQFHTHHDYYNMEFLGRTYFQPPFPHAYAWLMTAATVPTVTLLLFAVGLATAWTGGAGTDSRKREVRTEALWAICLFVNYAPWLSSATPIFGGTKHWLTAYPFLMLFAGMGADFVSRALERRLPRPRHLASAVSFASFLAAPAFETFHAHPWGLSAYTPLVGGAPGAATLGLNRGFWGYTTGSVVAFLNDHVPRGGSVYVHDTAWESWRMLQRDGRLRADIRGVASPAGADAALYHHEPHMEGVEYQEWIAFDTTVPADIRGLDGVPIVWVYARR